MRRTSQSQDQVQSERHGHSKQRKAKTTRLRQVGQLVQAEQNCKGIETNQQRRAGNEGIKIRGVGTRRMFERVREFESSRKGRSKQEFEISIYSTGRRIKREQGVSRTREREERKERVRAREQIERQKAEAKESPKQSEKEFVDASPPPFLTQPSNPKTPPPPYPTPPTTLPQPPSPPH